MVLRIVVRARAHLRSDRQRLRHAYILNLHQNVVAVLAGSVAANSVLGVGQHVAAHTARRRRSGWR